MADSIVSTHSVRARRAARKWSQAELAHRAGISRAAVSAIEGERLSPSVVTALALARVLECSVEELFGGGARPGVSGAEWAWRPQQEGCRYWEASIGARRWLYPVEAMSLNPTGHDGRWEGGVLRPNRATAPEATLVLACCDPAAGLLAAEYARASGFRMLVFPRGGRAALELLRQGLVHVAGVHYSTAEEPERNAGMTREHFGGEARLLRLARWEEGLVLAADDRSRSATSVARRGVRWAARERGSAARECLDELLGGRRLSGREVNGHGAVAEAVRAGWAEAGVCVRFSAAEAGLPFLPMRTEALDLCFAAAMEHEARLQALVRLLRGREWRRLLSELPGYHARETGELVALTHNTSNQRNP